MMGPRSSSFLTVLLTALLAAAAGCDDEAIEDTPEPSRIILLAAEDPDLSEPTRPQPGLLVWVSTRAGRARLLSKGRELSPEQQVVAGGEIVTTPVEASWLEPGINDVTIELQIRLNEALIIEATTQLLVTAECTWTRHCPQPGDCLAFECVDR